MIYDVAVVGLGAMGSAALYQLSKLGVSVIGLDRFPPPHTSGSHHGSSRVTRQAIGEGSFYVPLAVRSHEIWRELEAATGEAMLHEVGCLYIGNARDTGEAFGRPAWMATTARAAKEYGIALETLSPAEAVKRFPQFAVADDEVCFFEPGGGYLRPEVCIGTQLRLAASPKITVATGSPVVSVRQEADHVVVTTRDVKYRAARAIVSAGAGAAKILGAPFDTLLNPVRQAMHWFAPEPSFATHWASGPTYIWMRGNFIYGFPDIDGAGVKAADEFPGPGIDPDTLDTRVPPSDSARMYRDNIAGRFNGVSPQRRNAMACLYTLTPDHHFIIDEHPNADRILVVSPCSGHGFKHSAAIGEVAARRVAGLPTIDVSAFAVSRFG
jgi:sarcosine oxidase